MDFISQLPTPAINILILLIVIVLRVIHSRFAQTASIKIFPLYCQQLANKVNKDHHSENHRKIAGAIATLITFTPIIIILWLFEDFVEVPWLWSALLLYFAFGSFNLNALARQECKQLIAQDKYQAKQVLSAHLLRDTEQLSPLGLAKATIETLLLKHLQQQFVVGCYFLLFGPLAAFSYRLLLEMHYCWNTKVRRFRAFGLFVDKLTTFLQWLPYRLWLILLILTNLHQPIVLYWRLVKQHFFRLNSNLLIGYFAYILTVQLGGVAMYEREKLRRVSFNQQGRQPEVKHIFQAIKQLNVISTLIIGLLVSSMIIITILNVK